MGKEKITYEEMLGLLKAKQHIAPDNWQTIEDSLDLSDSLSGLPTHKAPDNLWEGIEAGLEGGVTTSKQTATISSAGTKRYLIAAIVLLLGLVMFMLMYLMPGNTAPGFKYKSETEEAVMQNNFAQLDNELDDVLMYIESNSFLYEDEKLAEFKQQLEELNAALEQISQMQDNYGTDASSTTLMAKMEREKVNLIKSMITNT